jgi:hypothetical protein
MAAQSRRCLFFSKKKNRGCHSMAMILARTYYTKNVHSYVRMYHLVCGQQYTHVVRYICSALAGFIIGVVCHNLFVTPPNIPPKKYNIKKTFGFPLTLYFFTCAVVHVCSRAVEAIGHAIRSHNEDDGCRRPDGNVRALPAGGCVPPPLKRRHHWQAPCSIVRFQHKLLAH